MRVNRAAAAVGQQSGLDSKILPPSPDQVIVLKLQYKPISGDWKEATEVGSHKTTQTRCRTPPSAKTDQPVTFEKKEPITGTNIRIIQSFPTNALQVNGKTVHRNYFPTAIGSS